MSSRVPTSPGAVATEPKRGAAGPAAERAAPSRSLLALWHRRWRLIVLVTTLGTALATVAGLQLGRQFRASAEVMIAPGQGDAVAVDAALADVGADPVTVEAQIELIKSSDHAERVARALDLHKDAELGPDDRNSGDLAFRIGDPWRALIGWMPGDWLIASGLAKERARDPSAERLAGLDHARDAFAERFAVSREGQSRVISISFTSRDPAKAALIVNRAAELHVGDRLAAKRSAIAKAIARLRVRVEALRAELEVSEQALASYRAAHDRSESDRTGLDEQELAGLRRELVVAEADLAVRRARLDLMSDLRARGKELKGLPEMTASPLVADLWHREAQLQRAKADLGTVYGENHPRMRAVLADQADLAAKIELATGWVINNLEREARTIEKRAAALQERLDLAKRADERRHATAVRLRELERETDGARQAYRSLLQRYQETRAQIVEPDAQIIVRATPPASASSPGVPMFAAFGFVGSSLAGVLLALLADRSDRRLRSGRQLQAHFGLPCLATCPRLPRSAVRRGGTAHGYLVEKPCSRYAESLRSLQLAVRGVHDAGLPQVIQVTSAVPDEGKTTLAMSLATLLAQDGGRVLLFELDLRRPSIDKRSWSSADEPGATTPLFFPLRHDRRTGVDLILVGNPPAHPQAVLMSEDLAGVMRRLRRRYEHIVVDSAPLLGLSDGKSVARLVDGIVLAVRWETTSLDLVGEALEELRLVSTPLLGAVITQVDLDRQARYGHGGAASCHKKYRGYYVD